MSCWNVLTLCLSDQWGCVSIPTWCGVLLYVPYKFSMTLLPSINTTTCKGKERMAPSDLVDPEKVLLTDNTTINNILHGESLSSEWNNWRIRQWLRRPLCIVVRPLHHQPTTWRNTFICIRKKSNLHSEPLPWQLAVYFSFSSFSN